MNAAHPSPDSLDSFLAGKLPREANGRVVRHLLTGCTTCREITGGFWAELEGGLRASRADTERESAAAIASRYDSVLDRAFQRATRQAAEWAHERQEAEARCEKLLRHPMARQITLVRNHRRFQTWSVCELLVDKSFECRFDSPKKMLEIAMIAVEVAERLDVATYGSGPAHDLKARAWTNLGNARRVQTDFGTAREAFERAEAYLAEGTGDPLERARLFERRSALERYRGKTREGTRLLDLAISIYRMHGRDSHLAWALSDKGGALAYSGGCERAVPFLEEALALSRSVGDLRLTLAARHNLTYCLNELGRHAEALRELEKLRPLHEELSDRMNLLRLRWLEGKILQGLERFDEAEAAFLAVRDGFIEEAIGYDGALVSLDLAMIYAAKGRVGELRRLAEEMLPIFESRDLHREALAALILFRQAAEAEQITLGLAREIASYLEKARNNPKLKFERAG